MIRPQVAIVLVVLLMIGGCSQLESDRKASLNEVKLEHGQKFGYKPPAP